MFVEFKQQSLFALPAKAHTHYLQSYLLHIIWRKQHLRGAPFILPSLPTYEQSEIVNVAKPRVNLRVGDQKCSSAGLNAEATIIADGLFVGCSFSCGVAPALCEPSSLWSIV